ncbi:MAG: hypothetical protein CVU94_08475 [Firmicutes bacterium HGW-Firmicutes-19]|nr:MAG: hypothetical protein CVU94_08475 [Firmicutes bacterium HGW-Firmicutes-19]
MKKYIQPALIANAASLGFHWIYDMDFLEELAKKQSLVFQLPSIEHYAQAKPSFFAYPYAKIGDVTTQGMYLKWLYEAVKGNPEFSMEDYRNLIFEQTKPGGPYIGYIETYNHTLIINAMSSKLRLNLPPLPVSDDHLVGFVPYLVSKELGLGNDYAWSLAQLFTDKAEYRQFFDMFDYIFENIARLPRKELLTNAIELAPESYREKLSMALTMEETRDFIKQYAGIACHIPQSVPLIFRILNQCESYQDMVGTNVRLGGASGERAMLLGAIFAQVSEIPENWVEKIK